MPDYNAPVVLHDHSPSIEDLCNRLHKQLILQFKYAWVWGSSVRHQPQKVLFILAIFIYLLLFSLVYLFFNIIIKHHMLTTLKATF
jgi:hypothetical protein